MTDMTDPYMTGAHGLDPLTARRAAKVVIRSVPEAERPEILAMCGLHNVLVDSR